jgi:hypothetical protein
MKTGRTNPSAAIALLLSIGLSLAGAGLSGASPAEHTGQTAPSINFMSWVGEEHNQGLRYILQHLEGVPEPAKRMDTIEKLLEQFNVGLRGSYTPPIRLAIPESPDDFDGYAWIEANCPDPALKPFLTRLVALIEADQSIEKFNSGLDELEESGGITIFGQNIRALFACTAVARASMSFWTPKELGGLGGASYLHSYAAAGCSSATTGKWRRIVLADTIGTAVGGVNGAIATSANAGMWWLYQ